MHSAASLRMCPLASVQTIVLLAHRRAAFDVRVELLSTMSKVIELETLEAFRGANTPEKAILVAEHMGIKRWPHWSRMLELAIEVGGDLGIDGDAVLQTTMERFPQLVQRNPFVGTHLPSEAAQHAHATFLLLGALPGLGADLPANSFEAFCEAMRAPVDAVPAQARQHIVLCQFLLIAMQRQEVSPDESTAVAFAMWRLVRGAALAGGADPEIVEDAFWSATADEVRDRNEPGIALDDVVSSGAGRSDA